MNESSVIRVLVFEDNPVMIDAFRMILSGSSGFSCVGVYESCRNWKHLIQGSCPDVILMDIEMKGMNGIEATRAIKKEFPDLAILIQTVYENEDLILEALCAGANGYILKSTSPAKLLEAITDVYQGGSSFSPPIAAKVTRLFQQFINPFRQVPDYALTGRELEILQYMTAGMALPKIAGKIFLSYHTVRDHVKNIYKKLHVASATEAVSKALREKIV